MILSTTHQARAFVFVVLNEDTGDRCVVVPTGRGSVVGVSTPLDEILRRYDAVCPESVDMAREAVIATYQHGLEVVARSCPGIFLGDAQ